MPRSSGRWSQRSTNTPRLSDNRDFYVCWAQLTQTEQVMKLICALWDEATVRNVLTGRSCSDAERDRQWRIRERELWLDA